MSNRHALLTLIKHGLIPADRVDEAILVSKIHPSDAQWFRFIDRLLAILGVTFISLAVIFFFAYNWADLGKFAKFATCEIAVIIALMIYLYAEDLKKILPERTKDIDLILVECLQEGFMDMIRQ